MRWLFAVFSGLIPFFAFAQKEGDTSVFLPEVQIVDSPLSLLEEGLDVMRVDSIHLQEFASNSISELLQATSTVFIKDYGPGAIATVGFRGLGAGQNVVYWNAIPLRSPNLGMQDISNLPVGAFDEIRVQEGGGAAMLGAGNMSGGIFLSNKPEFKKTASLRGDIAFASTRSLRSALNFRKGGKKFYVHSQFWFDKDENKYPYHDLHGVFRLRKHAAKQKTAFIQDMGYQINAHQYLQSGIWLDGIEAEVPGSITGATGDAVQSEQNRRFFMKYVYLKAPVNLRFQTSLLLNGMHYNDPDSIAQLAIDSYMRTRVWQNNLYFSRSLNANFSLFSGIYYTYESALSNNYEASPVRRQGGARFGTKVRILRDIITANIMASKEFLLPHSPVLFSVNSAFSLPYALMLKWHFSTNYRLPTFNDLYWVPLGNENLLPEKSRNYEAGLYFRPRAKKAFHLAMNVKAFYYSFFDRIIWLPTGGIWRPVNLGAVVSRGLESHIEVGITRGAWVYRLKTDVSYTLAKNGEYFLPYVPPLQIKFSNILSFSGFRLHLSNRYTSAFFTKTDNSYSLPAHCITDIAVSKVWRRSRHKIRLYFKVHNLFNTDYQFISYYPMPLRFYELRIAWDVDFIAR